MSHDINYETVVIPDGMPPSEYEYPERRAEILEFIKGVGNPYHIKKIDLAERYDVDPSTITLDFQRLAEYVEDDIGRNAKVTARTAMEKAVVELQEEGKYTEAFNVAMQWNKWLQSIGEQERVAFEADITHREAAMETDDYVLLEDDEAGAVIEESDEPPIPVTAKTDGGEANDEGGDNND